MTFERNGVATARRADRCADDFLVAPEAHSGGQRTLFDRSASARGRSVFVLAAMNLLSAMTAAEQSALSSSAPARAASPTATAAAVTQPSRVSSEHLPELLGHPVLAALDEEFGAAVLALAEDELRVVRVGDELGDFRIEAVRNSGLILRPLAKSPAEVRRTIREIWLLPADASGNSELRLVAKEPSAGEPVFVDVAAGTRDGEERKRR